MPSFEFVARTRTGETVRGRREAASDATLLSTLRSEGLITLRVDAAARTAPHRPRWWTREPTAQEVELEVRQLAFLVKSGVTLLHALQICCEQSPRPRVVRVLRAVADDIRDGSTLTDALRRQRAFDAITCSLVDVGERGGHLDVVLERAADLLARKRQLRTQVTTALIYPSLVLLLAIATVAYMMVGVVPKLTQFLKSLGRQLPPSTQLLVDVSTFVRAHYLDGLVVLALLAIALYCAWRTRIGRRAIDHALVRTPIVGTTVRLAAVASFAYTMGLLVRSGVRITSALSVVQPLLPLRLYTDRVDRARRAVVGGSGLAESLANERAFEPLVTGMVAVGESSGRLDDVFDHLADFHDARLRDLVRRLGTILEPVILVVIGGIVGFVYLSLFAALYSFAGRR